MLVAFPAAGLAGSYGDTAVKDATVGRTASAGSTIYCERLDQDIPVRLADRMDCGGGIGIAIPRVLSGDLSDDNPDNNDAGSGSGPHGGGGPDGGGPDGGDPDGGGPDGGGPDGVGPDGGSDNDPDGGTDTGDDPDGGTSTGDEPVSKWDRLNELGVERGTLNDQSDSFRDQFRDYRNEHGASGDWSGFNPTTD